MSTAPACIERISFLPQIFYIQGMFLMLDEAMRFFEQKK
jgi:hypothetical protein